MHRAREGNLRWKYLPVVGVVKMRDEATLKGLHSLIPPRQEILHFSLLLFVLEKVDNEVIEKFRVRNVIGARKCWRIAQRKANLRKPTLG